MRSFNETGRSNSAAAVSDRTESRTWLFVRDSFVVAAWAAVGIASLAGVLIVLPWMVSI